MMGGEQGDEGKSAGLSNYWAVGTIERKESKLRF